jgi:hypothetical protein
MESTILPAARTCARCLGLCWSELHLSHLDPGFPVRPEHFAFADAHWAHAVPHLVVCTGLARIILDACSVSQHERTSRIGVKGWLAAGIAANKASMD